MYLISPQSPNSKWKVKGNPYLYNLEFVIVYPLFSIIVFSYRTEHNPEYVSLLNLAYDIKVIHNKSGYSVNSLKSISAEKLQAFLSLDIQIHKKQGRKCSSEELLNIFLKTKDNVPYLSNLYMSN